MSERLFKLWGNPGGAGILILIDFSTGFEMTMWGFWGFDRLGFGCYDVLECDAFRVFVWVRFCCERER